MMKKEIAVFIADNYADYEISFICPELHNLKEKFDIKIIAPTNTLVVSMGGLKTIPDYSIDEYLDKNTTDFKIDMLLLCGGTIWSEKKYNLPLVKKLVDLCVDKKVLISAICDATTFLAFHSYLNTVKHTGNSLEFIINQCYEYTGKQYFIEKQCVYDGNYITANGTSTLEFTKEIMNYFNVNSKCEVENWYLFNKQGFYRN